MFGPKMNFYVQPGESGETAPADTSNPVDPSGTAEAIPTNEEISPRTRLEYYLAIMSGLIDPDREDEIRVPQPRTRLEKLIYAIAVGAEYEDLFSRYTIIASDSNAEFRVETYHDEQANEDHYYAVADIAFTSTYDPERPIFGKMDAIVTMDGIDKSEDVFLEYNDDKHAYEVIIPLDDAELPSELAGKHEIIISGKVPETFDPRTRLEYFLWRICNLSAKGEAALPVSDGGSNEDIGPRDEEP